MRISHHPAPYNVPRSVFDGYDWEQHAAELRADTDWHPVPFVSSVEFSRRRLNQEMNARGMYLKTRFRPVEGFMARRTNLWERER